ncbi:DNRLRE domain-containing protein [Streptomyces sp. AC555_RSS877]|uniref:DNRLRE domain-containing protein n=1 Tax=Streptomyces sp. AC555_RSS877 TaxID=2823688 RepID=UPI0020B7B4EA|nr:DNRLRE domain-containing protein [Streptomyces sp. AC555_RSS877]
MVLAAETAVTVATTGQAMALSSGTPTAASIANLGAAEASDQASALLMARLQDRKIEVLSGRTADSTTWALPSGALQTAAYAGPIRVKQDGVWQAIDTALSDTGAVLEPKAAAADIAVSDGGDKRLASVTKGDTTLGLGWENTLPTPTVKGDTASYGLGGGQTLTVTALPQGISQNVVLASAPDGAVSYRIPLDLDGLKLSQADSGHLLLKDTDGKLVAEAPAPMMWDSSKDPVSGEPEHLAQVATTVETASDGSQTLVLTADADFFRQDLTYPVTVDPTSTLAVTTDTWVQTPDYPDSQVSSPELKSGTYDNGTNKARSYLKFGVSAFAGKHIVDTNLSLYSYYSSTCSTTGAGTQVRRITSDWSSSAITWGAQPSTTATGAVTNTAALGYSSSCPAGTMNFDVDGIVQAWADGSANYGLQVRGADETDPYTWRRFRSANYISGDDSVEPHLTVTYNSYPVTPANTAVSPSVVNAYNGKRYVTSLTPQLSAKVSDADGATVKAQFEITPDPAYNDTTYTYTATSTGVASGSTALLTIPSANAFPAASHLRYRVRGYDNTDYGSWTGYSAFALNTGKPTAPSVTCTPYTKDTWTAKDDNGASCTLDTASGDGQGYYWGLDNSSTPNRIDDTVDGNGGDPLTITVKPGDGWHSLYAKTIDSGGNLSTTSTEYKFGVGADGAALLAPGDGDRPARRVALAATGKPTYTGVTYQYRRGETDSWHTVPLADVTKNADGTAVASWPLAAPNGAPPALTWNITTTLAEDGPIDIRAAFTDGTTTGYSTPNTVTVDRNAGDAPTQEVGPGDVNMLTGDFTLIQNDAAAFGVSIDRTASSRGATTGEDMEGQAAIFGPGWISGVTAERTGSDWSTVRKTSATSVEVLDADGTAVGFTATSAGGWQPEPGLEDLTLTSKDSAGVTTNDLTKISIFTLQAASGATTTFAKVDPAATAWQATTFYLATANSTITVVSEKVTGGSQTLARPKYLIAPTTAVSNATCAATPSAKGCRLLEIVYSSTTTATGTAFGEYAGTAKEIKQWSTEPGAAAATAKTVQWYQYDGTGHLRGTWSRQISPATFTEYSYDSANRVTKFTQPGELPWTLSYGRAGNAATAGDGMLLAASRPGLKQGTADITEGTAAINVVYDVPLSGTAAPYAMAPANVAAWGQEDVPTDATAVFPADAIPASHDGRTLTASAYRQAEISYADASGRQVNTAAPGGHIAATEYDHLGNALRELSAGNRELALATGGSGLETLTRLGLSGSSTAVRAVALSTVHVFSSDGQREVESFGPLHLAILTGTLKAGAGGTDLPAGTEAAVTKHTVTAYDEGRPTDGSAKVSGLPTTVTTGAHVDGYPADGDAEVTKTTYDWAKGSAISTIEDAGGKNLTKTTAYDTQGRTTKTTLPKSTGTDAGATVTTYWSATGTGACNGRPEWADLVCSTGPAGAITGGGSNPTQLPTKTVEYGWWGQPSKISDTANGVTRTTTIITDTLGRISSTSVTGGVGTAMPDITTTYDSNNGRIATQTANGQTITTGYDKLGRQISYNDGAGNTTTTAYDLLDRPVKLTDSAPSTQTITYDANLDPRGLPTSLTDSVAGTFAATYGAEGELLTEQLPGGYTLTTSTDNVGQMTSAVYSRDSDGTVVLADTGDYSTHGRLVNHTGTAGDTTAQAYTYDKVGRLTGTDDTSADGSCTRRTYGFDNNSNRTSLASSTSAPGTACAGTGATTTTSTYDSADRLIASGTTYDAFGRTTGQASGAAIGYYVNDLVRRQAVGTNRQTWDLDAAGRLASWTTETQGADQTWSQTGRKTNHYGSDGDSPDWITEDSSGTISRSVRGLTGSLEAVTSATGGVVLQLTTLHGDLGVQLPLDTTKNPVVLRQDEFGNPVPGSVPVRYGWLGGPQRSGETATGAILMGVRLYDPTSGRFLSTDPMLGGNANAYDYAFGDPINRLDLDGRWSWWKTWYYSWGRVKIHAWRFWDWQGLHVGGSVYVYFNRYWTRQIAAHIDRWWERVSIVGGIVAAMTTNKAVIVAAGLLWLYGYWVYGMADYAAKHGQCLRVKAASGYLYWWYSYMYPSHVSC